jgi:hypothetical protein
MVMAETSGVIVPADNRHGESALLIVTEKSLHYDIPQGRIPRLCRFLWSCDNPSPQGIGYRSIVKAKSSGNMYSISSLVTIDST